MDHGQRNAAGGKCLASKSLDESTREALEYVRQVRACGFLPVSIAIPDKHPELHAVSVQWHRRLRSIYDHNASASTVNAAFVSVEVHDSPAGIAVFQRLDGACWEEL